MGLVIGISACVGCAYAANKTRKRRKKKRLEKLSPDDDDNVRQIDQEEYDDEGIDVTQDEVISETVHSESVRKRKKGKPVENEHSSKAKPHKTTTRRKKLQEEEYEVEQSKSGSLRSQRSNGTPSGKSKKNYRHVEMNDSTSEDEGHDRSRKEKKTDCYGKESGDSDYDSEEVAMTRNMRLSIRVSETGNTIFKIYAKNKEKQPSQELTSTTGEITV